MFQLKSQLFRFWRIQQRTVSKQHNQLKQSVQCIFAPECHQCPMICKGHARITLCASIDTVWFSALINQIDLGKTTSETQPPDEASWYRSQTDYGERQIRTDGHTNERTQGHQETLFPVENRQFCRLKASRQKLHAGAFVVFQVCQFLPSSICSSIRPKN